MILLPVSHFRQKQQADCLAACAVMVLDYLQIPIDYDNLIQLLGVDAIGTPFRRLQNLENLGLNVQVGEGSISTLRTNLEAGLPSIVAVDTSELPYWEETADHAVIVVGLDEEQVYLNDPDTSKSPQAAPIPEFELAWLEKDYLFAVIKLA